MDRRSSRALCGLVAATAVLAAGCGEAFLAASPREAEPVSWLEAVPVADLSGTDLGLPRFFLGLGYAQMHPEDSSLRTGTVYDLNVAYDMSSWLTMEFAFGLWDIGDQPVGVPGADSILEMRPALLMLQLYGEVPACKSRVYIGVGGGYSVNSYDLGGTHEYYVENVDGIPDYGVNAADATLWQLALGADIYSTADAELNLGIELRYVIGTVERVERSGETPFNVDEVELRLYLIRANVTWHF